MASIFEDLMVRKDNKSTLTESVVKQESVKNPEIKKYSVSKFRLESRKIFEEESLDKLDTEFAKDPESEDESEVVLVIDPEVNADEELPEDAAEDAIGDYVYKCPVCGSNYLCNCDASLEEGVEVDEEGVPTECPICGDDTEQILIGEIAPVEDAPGEEVKEMEPVEPEEEETEEESEEVTEESLKVTEGIFDKFKKNKKGKIDSKDFDKYYVVVKYDPQQKKSVYASEVYKDMGALASKWNLDASEDYQKTGNNGTVYKLYTYEDAKNLIGKPDPSFEKSGKFRESLESISTKPSRRRKKVKESSNPPKGWDEVSGDILEDDYSAYPCSNGKGYELYLNDGESTLICAKGDDSPDDSFGEIYLISEDTYGTYDNYIVCENEQDAYEKMNKISPDMTVDEVVSIIDSYSSQNESTKPSRRRRVKESSSEDIMSTEEITKWHEDDDNYEKYRDSFERIYDIFDEKSSDHSGFVDKEYEGLSDADKKEVTDIIKSCYSFVDEGCSVNEDSRCPECDCDPCECDLEFDEKKFESVVNKHLDSTFKGSPRMKVESIKIMGKNLTINYTMSQGRRTSKGSLHYEGFNVKKGMQKIVLRDKGVITESVGKESKFEARAFIRGNKLTII